MPAPHGIPYDSPFCRTLDVEARTAGTLPAPAAPRKGVNMFSHHHRRLSAALVFAVLSVFVILPASASPFLERPAHSALAQHLTGAWHHLLALLHFDKVPPPPAPNHGGDMDPEG